MLDRRNLLKGGAGVLGSSLLLTAGQARAAAPTVSPENTATEMLRYIPPPSLQGHLQELFGDAPILAGRVSLALPALAENGNSVALGATAIADNSSAAPRRLFLLAEKNPLPDIAHLTFSDTHSGPVEFAMRIRLADSQRIVGIAQYADGALYAGEASIIVTLAACIDLPL